MGAELSGRPDPEAAGRTTRPALSAPDAAADAVDAETPALLPAPEDGRPAHTPDELRRALGRFATGVTIVTCRDAAGEPVGLTANSFNALSLHPALVLWSLRSQSFSAQAFAGATHFGVNVLSVDQVHLSRRFARPQREKFDEGTWHDGLGGVPVLDGCVAVFECLRRSHQAAGDHLLFIGEVLRLRETDLPPLVYQGGHYREVGGPL
jgi:3-hydroxy-9,10-secoandrosta-1,3,5(10)-triene-9,17-dione monooxygenase reductase component